MQHTKHSLLRMNQRGIPHALADLAYEYGFTQGDKVVFNQKAATARLIEARAEMDGLSAMLNATPDVSGTMHQIRRLDTEIRNLVKLIDKKGCVVVMAGDVLITAYGIH